MEAQKMADESPDTLAIANANVKRLNSRPLMIVGGIGVLMVFALIYAVNQSAKRSQPKVDAAQGEPEQKHSVQDTKAVIADMTKGVPESGEVPDASFVPPSEAHSSSGKAALAAGRNGVGAANLVQSGNGKLSPEEEWLLEYKTSQQKKEQLYETALLAPTRISVTTSESRAANSGNGMPSSADISALGSAAQRAQQAGAMQSAALKAAMGNQDANGQDEKNDFAQKELRAGYLTATREMPLSPFEIKMGTVIPAIMVTGVNSDLPGELIAQVSQDVWDTATGRHLLIPQGSKLFGIYDSHVMFGQNRVLIAWTRITFPDASTLDLGHMSGADQAGYAGFSDKVNNHYVKIFGSALLMSIISAGVQLSQPQTSGQLAQPSAQQTAAAAMAQQLGQTGNAILQKNLNIQPTIEIRPGYRFNVMVSKDILLPSPYRKG
jgi:type IV secretion system protein VirB10